jgi:hypothetical protein
LMSCDGWYPSVRSIGIRFDYLIATVQESIHRLTLTRRRPHAGWVLVHTVDSFR